MPLTTGNANYMAIVGDLAKKVDVGLANKIKEATWHSYVTELTTNKLIEREESMEEMASLPAWQEGTQRDEMSPNQGYAQKYRQFQFGGLIDITKAMMKFKRTDTMDRLAQQLRDSADKSLDILFTMYLAYGDTTTVPQYLGTDAIQVLGGDGQALFYGSHTWRSSSNTWSNLSGSADDLTESSIQSVYAVVRRWQASDGTPLNVNMKGVIIPVDLRFKAEQIFRSELTPGSANNAVNTAPILVKKTSIIENPYLSDTTDWYVKTDARDSGIRCYWGWKPEVSHSSGKEDRTGNEFIAIDYSIGHGFLDGHALYKVSA